MKEKMSSYLLLCISVLLMGCAENSVRKTATEYLKEQMKDPTSFKVKSAEVVLDTVPLFLNKKLLSCAMDVSKAIDEKNRYKDRDSYYWREEKEKASRNLSNAFLDFSEECKKLKKKGQPMHYMVMIDCSANNSYGGTVSSKYIVVVDKNNTDKVLGEYRLDSDFAKEVVTAYMMSGSGDLDENEFGKIDTSKMSDIEKFIFDN